MVLNPYILLGSSSFCGGKLCNEAVDVVKLVLKTVLDVVLYYFVILYSKDRSCSYILPPLNSERPFIDLYNGRFNTVADEGILLKKMIEFRWHGRGGQGAWTASELLARTALNTEYDDGTDKRPFPHYDVQAFPEFGPERMGAPVTAYNRIKKGHLRIAGAVYYPDVVIVLDNTLLKTVRVIMGLKTSGYLLVNSEKDPAVIAKELGVAKGCKVYTVNATEIAGACLGDGLKTNTTMLGVIAKIMEEMGILSLEGIKDAIVARFSPGLAEKNIEAVDKAYKACGKGFLVVDGPSSNPDPFENE